MLIKKFVGTDEKALMQRVRSGLGSDAVILHTSVIQPSGWMRFFRRPRVEIVAGSGFQIVKDYARKGSGAPATAPPPSAPPPDRLQQEIREIRRLVVEQGEWIRQDRSVDVPENLAPEYLALTSAEVSQPLARRLLQKLRERFGSVTPANRSGMREALRGALREMVRCADGITLQPGRCTRVAFIGPTGVGKTTTIAKLVSIYAHRGTEVAVITNDTYRIAATEQIRRIAQLVGVPLRVCAGPQEVQAAVKEFSDRDLVLIDTAGRSQRNATALRELQEVLAAAQADEIHLVLSVASQVKTLLDVVERFSPCGFRKIVFTKLDEAVKTGLILDVLSHVQHELSFLTTGQEIPRDIEIADPGRLTSLILGEEGLASN